MTTRLKPDAKGVARIINLPSRGEVVVTMTPHGVVYRYLRKRFSVMIPHGVAFVRAEQLAGDAAAEAKGTKRRKRRRR